MSDKNDKTREEVAQVRAEKDPITRIQSYILENNLATEDEIKVHPKQLFPYPSQGIEKEIRKEVDDAVKKAREAPFPDLKELYTNVYTPDSKPYYVRAVEHVNSVIVE